VSIDQPSPEEEGIPRQQPFGEPKLYLGPPLTPPVAPPAPEPSPTIDEGRHCRHCGRHLVYWQATYLHASAWDAAGQRELYLHCRVQIADPANEDERGVDEINREAALTAWMNHVDDWAHLTPEEADAVIAFRAGWREARA
jgi:hypothetical protein